MLIPRKGGLDCGQNDKSLVGSQSVGIMKNNFGECGTVG